MNTMKIALLNPSNDSQEDKRYYSFPLNLGYIASYLEEKGYKVKIIDMNILSEQKTFLLLNEFCPSVIGITVQTAMLNYSHELVKKCKEICPQSHVVMGGPHCSAEPVKTLEKNPYLDYVIYGEGEITFYELVEAIKTHTSFASIDGLAYRDSDFIQKNKPRELIETLDILPFPARHLVHPKNYFGTNVTNGYFGKDLRAIDLLTSRGCVGNCIFCAGNITFKQKIRFRSYENIVAELDSSIAKYDINHVFILDDVFTLNKELVSQLSSYFKRKKLTWSCTTRVDLVDSELLKVMKQGGCKKVNFGVESGSDTILQLNKKGITKRQITTAIENVRKARIKYIECNFIIGSHPDETVYDIYKTMDLIHQIKPDFIAVTVIEPFPGTQVYELMKEKELLYERYTIKQNQLPHLSLEYKIKHLNMKQLQSLRRMILKKYYLSVSYVWRQAKKMESFHEFFYYLKHGFSFFHTLITKINKK